MRKYGTNDPMVLADYLNVTIIRMPLEDMVAGFYKMIKRRKYIFLNTDIDDESFMRVVLAHELGHAIMHPKENCAFLKNHTLFLTSRLEIEANTFAAYLLISHQAIEEYMVERQYTTDMMTRLLGYQKELVELRFK
jgi:hypothetical protein